MGGLTSGSWKKGYCPNPGGRAKNVTANALRDKALSYCMEGIEYLVRVLRDTNEPTKNRLVATSMLFDRGLGKPAQSIELKDLNGVLPDITNMTRADIEAAHQQAVNLISDATKSVEDRKVVNKKGEVYEG